jgi:hypothetical protein
VRGCLMGQVSYVTVNMERTTDFTIIVSQCYESFRELLNGQEILDKYMELEHVMEDETIAQRQKAFKKLVESFQHLASEASRDRVETLIFLAGTSVNEDSAITLLLASEAMETVSFLLKLLSPYS